MSEEICHDLEATVDYLLDVMDRSDGGEFDFEAAAEIRQRLEAVKKAAADAVAMFDTELLRRLEATPARTVGKTLFKRVPKQKRRHDHAKIAQRLREWARRQAINEETGEINAERAVEEVARAFADLYISRSKEASSSKFGTYGITTADVTSWEDQGHRLEVESLERTGD